MRNGTRLTGVCVVGVGWGGGECINVHVHDRFAAGFFCENSRFGNHLTSVTSCYVSAGQRASKECEMEGDNWRGLKKKKGGGLFNSSHF